MTLEQQQNADLAGMIEAGQRYGNSDLQQYHEKRDLPGLPYVAGKSPDNGELLPLETRRRLAAFSIGSAIVSMCAGFIQVCASGAMNAVFQYAAGAGVVVFLISSLRGGQKTSGRKSTGENHYHYYYQNNSFGGNASQDNGK